MSNLKKILAMALTVLMVVGSFAMTATASFDDVTDYQEAIEVMAALGIASGKSESEFAPDDDVTREEMALWIAKIMTGKVAADYVTNNFLGAVENLTAFADLDEDNYVGAINYATNNGIIVGTSATTFEPAEAIKIQDVFAMVVRMLGYGSTAMNNNYPWSFIDKAISLGLDADLPADYANEAIASRGETMQILYNALTALKSDGSTLGYDFFGLEKATVVITGTSAANAYVADKVPAKTVDGVDYVSFALLGANGNVSSNNIYYALKTEFGIAADVEAKLFVGDSFVVRSVDGFETFLTCEACDYEVVDQTVFKGATSGAVVTIDGVKYNMVKAYSEFLNGTKTTNDTEIIVNLPNGEHTTAYETAGYVMDKDLNILAADGSILLHWVSTNGSDGTFGNFNGMYLFDIGNGQYIQPNDYIWSLAAKHSVNGATVKGFATTILAKEVNAAFAEVVLYDDDANGEPDRAIYYEYKFGKAGKSTLKEAGKTYDYLTINGAAIDDKKQTIAKTSFYNAEGEKISYDDIAGKYVMYFYDSIFKTFIVKEVYSLETGLVTGVDLVNKTLTLNAFGANLITGVVAGETYKLGIAKFDGAEYDDIATLGVSKGTKGFLTEAIGKNINFVERDGVILAIESAITDAKHMVYVNANAGYTTMGYNNIVAFYNPAANKIGATQAVVTVNAVGNYWYSGLFNNGVASVDNTFVKGDLLKATKDALGNYDVAKEAYSYIVSEIVNGQVKTYIEDEVISINNGIISSANAQFNPWKVNASTIYIVYNGEEFKSYVGVPASGAKIEVTGKAYINSSENFVYVNGGSFDVLEANNSFNPWGDVETNTTIIYVDKNAAMTMVADNALNYGAGVLVGTKFAYTKAIDVIKGGYAPVVYTNYGFGTLKAGSFYYVRNGVVESEITPDAAGSVIKTGKLATLQNSEYNSVVYAKKATTMAAANIAETYANAFPVVYRILSENIWAASGAPIDIMVDKSANTANAATSLKIYNAINDTDLTDGDAYVDVYYYDGEEFAASYDYMPVFIVKTSAGDADGSLAVPAATTTEAPVNYTVEFKAFGFTADCLANEVGFYKTSSNGAHVDFAGKITLDDSAKYAEEVALQKKVTTKAYGATTGSTVTVDTPATYVLAIARSVSANWNVYLTTAKKDIDGTIDSEGYAIEIVKTAYDLTTDSDLYFFEVSADMAVVDAADAAQSTVYVNINAVAKN